MVRRGFRGWEVVYKDGVVINEEQEKWSDISKKDIITLTLHYDGRQWDINNKKDYYQRKKASVVPVIPGSFRIESRSIGFYEGNSRILYTVNERTGRMKMEVEVIK